MIVPQLLRLDLLLALASDECASRGKEDGNGDEAIATSAPHVLDDEIFDLRRTGSTEA